MSNARWFLAWLLALTIALAAGIAFERHLRALDYRPTVQDDPDLWCLAYQRVREDPRAIALLGASRIQFAIDPRLVEQATGRPTAMLAVNGHYPLAALRLLAEDEAFRGLALVGIDARGFNPLHRDMQEPWAEHWKNRWSPARRINRELLTPLQANLVLARSPFSLANLARRHFDGLGMPFNDYVLLRPDRVGFVDYRRTDIQAIKRQRIIDLEQYYRDHPAPPATQWLDAAQDVAGWVSRIEARGGSVVFFREPVSGESYALDETHYPRARYWDPLIARWGFKALDFQDEPAFAAFETPDTSHIDGTEVPRFTQVFVDALRRRHFILADQ